METPSNAHAPGAEQDPSDEPAPPERVGPVEIRGAAPSSGGARVMLGRTGDGRRATVWTWPSSALGEEDLPRLTRIIDALDRSALPTGLPRVVHGSVGADRAVIAFERQDGEPLSERLERDTASAVEVLRGAGTLLEALETARSLDAPVGRWDPRTIQSLQREPAWSFQGPGIHTLLCGDRRPALADVHEAAACAPEVATGAVSLDEATDPEGIASEAYSLGVTMFYALTGGLPFSERDPSAYLRRQLGADARSLSEVAPQLDRFRLLADLVARCLARAPGERPQSYRALREDIAAATREAERLDSDVAFLPVRVQDTMEIRRARLRQPPTARRQRVSNKVLQIAALVVLLAILLFLLLRTTSAHVAHRSTPGGVPAVAAGEDAGAPAGLPSPGAPPAPAASDQTVSTAVATP
ncbi:MAG: hypothetical protein ACQEXJ_00195 [Myxococcota bacterium]